MNVSSVSSSSLINKRQRSPSVNSNSSDKRQKTKAQPESSPQSSMSDQRYKAEIKIQPMVQEDP